MKEYGKIKRILIFIAIAVATELFVCNYQFWVSHLFYPKEVVYNSEDIQFGTGFIVNGKEIVVNALENCTLTLENIDKTAKSLVLDISKKGIGGSQDNTNLISCLIAIKDEGNMASYYSVPNDGSSWRILPTVKNSEWIRLHPYGKLHGVQITLDQSRIQVGDAFQMNAIIINGRHSMNFSWIRLIALVLVILFFGSFRESSKWYTLPFISLSKQKKKCLVIVMVVAQILILWGMGQVTRQCGESHGFKEYHWLTKTLAEGRTWLEQPPARYLQEMENPYDTSMRDSYRDATGENYMWDVAYYGGKYYVYFGVIPVLLLYLPYYLLTGKMLSDTIVALLAAAISIIFLARFIKVVVERYFPKTSVLTYVLLLWASTTAIGFINLLRSAMTYEVAIGMGLMFAIAGFDLWVESVQGDKVLSKTKLFLGSLCIALIAGCRPGMILIAFTSLLIFRQFIIKDKKICLQNHRNLLIIFSIPFLVVAVGLMYYNCIRFGSPFDFGEKYNLTTNDVAHRGFSMGRIPIGIFEYLFGPMVVNGVFPFIHNKNVVSAYMGKTIAEPMAGGIFCLFPFLLLSLLPWIRKKLRKEYFEWAACSMLLLVMGVMIAMVDSSAGGILCRYQADFTLFFILSAVFAVLMQEDTWLCKQNRIEKVSAEAVELWHTLLVVLTLATVVVGYLLFFLPYRFDMETISPTFYYRVKYLFEFWR